MNASLKRQKQDRTAKGRFVKLAPSLQIQSARSHPPPSTGRAPSSCGASRIVIQLPPPREDALAAFMFASTATPTARSRRTTASRAERQSVRLSRARWFVAIQSAHRGWGIARRRKRSADSAGEMSPKPPCAVLSWRECAFASTPCFAFLMCSNMSRHRMEEETSEATVPYHRSPTTSVPMASAPLPSHSAR